MSRRIYYELFFSLHISSKMKENIQNTTNLVFDVGNQISKFGNNN
jgi:hypothetical protein